MAAWVTDERSERISAAQRTPADREQRTAVENRAKDMEKHFMVKEPRILHKRTKKGSKSLAIRERLSITCELPGCPPESPAGTPVFSVTVSGPGAPGRS